MDGSYPEMMSQFQGANAMHPEEGYHFNGVIMEQVEYSSEKGNSMQKSCRAKIH